MAAAKETERSVHRDEGGLLTPCEHKGIDRRVIISFINREAGTAVGSTWQPTTRSRAWS
jgi:hypothetical protein